MLACYDSHNFKCITLHIKLNLVNVNEAAVFTALC